MKSKINSRCTLDSIHIQSRLKKMYFKCNSDATYMQLKYVLVNGELKRLFRFAWLGGGWVGGRIS